MKHVAIDTNVALDYQLGRPLSQAAEQLFQAHSEGTVEIYVPLPVFLECEWVLRTVYGKPKREVLYGLSFLYKLAARTDMPLDLMVRAMAQYRISAGINFVDCLISILTLEASVDDFVTGDKKLARLYQSLKRKRRR